MKGVAADTCAFSVRQSSCPVPSTGDTKPVPVKDIEGVRTALRANELTELIGLAECEWLDVKQGGY